MSQSSKFLDQAEQKAFDLAHRGKLRFNIGKYDQKVLEGKTQFAEIELARMHAKNTKWKSIENLDKLLIEFEEKFTARGGKVIWAVDTKEALQAIGEIAEKHGAKNVVKSKSMTTEEIELNEFCEKNGIKAWETDLGEYIQQLDGEKPYHIVTPAMHKSKEDVARLFHEKLGTEPNLTPTELTLVARKILREKYTTSEIGITGGNFLIANPGAIALTENEGNARLTTSFPKVHIAVVGIEKVIPSMEDLDLYWPLLSTFGTGQKLTVYNSIFGGPRQAGEVDGPEEMYVVLLDNGRTDLIAEPQQREALYCIRCGACLNACPVYKNIGGHTYDTTYSGPIGSVITPHFKGMEDFKHLSNASSLCGNCTEVCPVRIDLHNLLLYNRRDAVESGHSTFTERNGWKAWRIGMLSRRRMNLAGSGLKNSLFKMFFGKSWGKRRSLPVVQKSFSQQWVERLKAEKKLASVSSKGKSAALGDDSAGSGGSGSGSSSSGSSSSGSSGNSSGGSTGGKGSGTGTSGSGGSGTSPTQGTGSKSGKNEGKMDLSPVPKRNKGELPKTRTRTVRPDND